MLSMPNIWFQLIDLYHHNYCRTSILKKLFVKHSGDFSLTNASIEDQKGVSISSVIAGIA
jgi:hypothetical protein